MPEQNEKFEELLFQFASECKLKEMLFSHEPDDLEESGMLEAIDVAAQAPPGSKGTSLPDKCVHCRAIVEIVSQAVQEFEEERDAECKAENVDLVFEKKEAESIGDRFKAVFGSFARGLQFLCGTTMPEAVACTPLCVRSSSQAIEAVDQCFSEFRTNLGGNLMRVQVERLPSGLLDIHISTLKKAASGQPVRAILVCGSKVLDSVPFEGSSVHFKDLPPNRYLVKLTDGTSQIGHLDLVFMSD